MKPLSLERVLWSISTNNVPIGSIIDRLSGGMAGDRKKLEAGQLYHRLQRFIGRLIELELVVTTNDNGEQVYRKVLRAREKLAELQSSSDALSA